MFHSVTVSGTCFLISCVHRFVCHCRFLFKLTLLDSPEYSGNKIDMSLTLVNKFEVPEHEDLSVKALFSR